MCSEPDRTPLNESSDSSSAAHDSLILVADDDSDIQQAIARSVSRAGYQTTFAADGKTALDLFTRLTAEDKQPSLIIADVGLPEIDGRTLSLTLQKQFSSVRILLTSGSKIETNSAGKTADGFQFLPKPFEPDELISMIERLLNRQD